MACNIIVEYQRFGRPRCHHLAWLKYQDGGGAVFRNVGIQPLHYTAGNSPEVHELNVMEEMIRNILFLGLFNDILSAIIIER
jgi:hypothetical protein